MIDLYSAIIGMMGYVLEHGEGDCTWVPLRSLDSSGTKEYSGRKALRAGVEIHVKRTKGRKKYQEEGHNCIPIMSLPEDFGQTWVDTSVLGLKRDHSFDGFIFFKKCRKDRTDLALPTFSNAPAPIPIDL